jgi:hypothetical protein
LHRRLAIADHAIGIELDQHVVEVIFAPIAGFKGMHQLHFDMQQLHALDLHKASTCHNAVWQIATSAVSQRRSAQPHR